jgi:hypothetical protein
VADQVRTGAEGQGDDPEKPTDEASEGAGAKGVDDRLDRIERALSQIASLSEVSEVRPITPARHVLVWFLGVVVASLLPFVPLVVHHIDSRSSPGMYDLLGRGDLLVVSLVFTIAGLVELGLYWKRIEQADVPIFLMIGGILLVLGEGFWYGDITSQILSGGTVPTHAVTYGSLGFFAFSVVCSLLCVRLAAGVH